MRARCAEAAASRPVLDERKSNCVLVTLHKAKRAVHRVEHPVAACAPTAAASPVDATKHLLLRQRAVPRIIDERVVHHFGHTGHHGCALSQTRAVLFGHQRHIVAECVGQDSVRVCADASGADRVTVKASWSPLRTHLETTACDP